MTIALGLGNKRPPEDKQRDFWGAEVGEKVTNWCFTELSQCINSNKRTVHLSLLAPQHSVMPCATP